MSGITSLLNRRDWNAAFTSWTSQPSATETEKCNRAIRAIEKAVTGDRKLSLLGCTCIVQGSYANHTNVRLDSDVDVGVLYPNTHFFEMPPGYQQTEPGGVPATYFFNDFKNDLQGALEGYFGKPPNVVRGKKSFDIHENTYRVDADAVALFPFYKYFVNAQNNWDFHVGTALLSDTGIRCTNFRDQQLFNGNAKDVATGGNFKRLVRIIKNLRNEMVENGVAAAEPIPSYLIECLVWNWSFTGHHQTWKSMVDAFLSDTLLIGLIGQGWTESNRIKKLFGDGNTWTTAQVSAFISAAQFYIQSQ